VSATNDETNGGSNLLSEKRRKQVPFDMIHRNKWPTGRDGETFRETTADHQRGGQTRALRGGESIDITDPEVGLIQCAFQDRFKDAQMIAGRNLWYNAAIDRMKVDLRRDFAGEEFPAPHQTNSRFIARRLNCEDHPWVRLFWHGP